MRLVFVIALIAAAGAAAAVDYTKPAVLRWQHFYLWKWFSGQPRQHGSVPVSDAAIHFETFGVGSPVLVLHGGLGSIEGMSSQIISLSKAHYVIAVDSRGHGRSTDGADPLSYSGMSNDVVHVLDYLHVPRTDVVGWSDGAIVALDLAMHYPDRVRKVVAISANYNPEGLEAIPEPPKDTPPLPLRYRLLSPAPDHWAVIDRKVVNMWRTQPRYTPHDLAQIKAPTLIMAGEHDAIRRDHTDQLSASIPGSRESIIAGATHSVPTDQPEVVNQQILEFLDR